MSQMFSKRLSAPSSCIARCAFSKTSTSTKVFGVEQKSVFVLPANDLTGLILFYEADCSEEGALEERSQIIVVRGMYTLNYDDKKVTIFTATSSPNLQPALSRAVQTVYAMHLPKGREEATLHNWEYDVKRVENYYDDPIININFLNLKPL